MALLLWNVIGKEHVDQHHHKEVTISAWRASHSLGSAGLTTGSSIIKVKQQ
jgi:hypothetical protein